MDIHLFSNFSFLNQLEITSKFIVFSLITLNALE